jgi:pre-60S factor REI1
MKPHKLSDTELLLPSGVVVGSRSESPRARGHTPSSSQRGARQAIGEGENPASQAESGQPQRRDVAIVRGELGLVGVSGQQRRALMVVEKKMQKREMVARAAHMWAREKIANRQKHYRVSFSIQEKGERFWELELTFFLQPDNPARPNG